MPYITASTFKTKKSFREAVERNPKAVTVIDPSIFDPYTGSVLRALEERGTFVVTSHPARKWFAKVSIKNGKIKVE